MSISTPQQKLFSRKLPVIALVGRPNVGKSTLFNALTLSRQALVMDEPGVTRDRIYGECHLAGRHAMIIDTGGLSHEPSEGLAEMVQDQTFMAIEEADLIFWIVDGRAGLTHLDEELAVHLRRAGKRLHILVNKAEGLDPAKALREFYALGFRSIFAISAAHRQGIEEVLQALLPGEVKATEEDEEASDTETEASPVVETPKEIKVALIGRPNVGKSTLVNRLLGEQRVLVFDMPGTTRDSVYLPLEHQGQSYILIDTAGLRRKGRVGPGIEKFSAVKTLQSIADSDVVLMLMDATEGVSEQDLHIMDFATRAGRAMVLLVNKWDGLTADQRARMKSDLDRRLDFLGDSVEIHFISALKGTGVGALYGFIREAYRSATIQIPTNALTEALEQAVLIHSPPMVSGRRIKLRYAHMGGQQPPVIVLHGNQTEHLPMSYQRYLITFFRKKFKLKGTPLRLELRSSKNPYATTKKD